MKINLFGKTLYGMVDTGATLSAISGTVINHYNWKDKLEVSD